MGMGRHPSIDRPVLESSKRRRAVLSETVGRKEEERSFPLSPFLPLDRFSHLVRHVHKERRRVVERRQRVEKKSRRLAFA